MRSPLLVTALALSCHTSEPSRNTDVSAADVPADTAVEFGHVRWQRRLEPALESASKADKPVLLLFQEVPG